MSQVIEQNDLPNEMLFEIFKHLDVQSLLACKYVCRHWSTCADYFISNETWIFHQCISTTGLIWKSGLPEDIPNRYYHLSCVHDDQLIIFGGFFDSETKADSRNDLWTFDINSHTLSFSKTTGELPHIMAYGKMLSYKDKVFLVGGQKTCPRTDQGEMLSNDIYELDFNRLEWSLIKPTSLKPPLMSQHGSNIWNDEIIVFGGINILTNHINANEENEKFDFDYKYYLGNDVYVFNIKTNKWRKAITYGQPPCPRYAHSTFIYNGHLTVIGGVSSCEKALNDIWTLDLRYDNWNWDQVTCLKNGEPFTYYEIGASPLSIFSNIIFGFTAHVVSNNELSERANWMVSDVVEYFQKSHRNGSKYFAIDLTRMISDKEVDWQEQSKPTIGPRIVGRSIDTRSKQILLFGGRDLSTKEISNCMMIGSINQNRIYDLKTLDKIQK